jgi:ubiquinone/menaquinone biosynthesis C-methylase UbiE
VKTAMPGNMLDAPATRKDYMRRVYSKYWLNKVPSFPAYDRNLCDLVASVSPAHAHLLEVASGTGYPFSQELRRRGYRVYGVDIAEALVRESYRLDARAMASVGDAEKLPFPARAFDATFCFHSTFFFPSLLDALDEMIRVTKKDGAIVFDVQNAEHPAIALAYARRRTLATGNGRWFRYAKNLVKIALRRGFPDWSSVVREVPSDWRTVGAHLRARGLREITLLGRDPDANLRRIADESNVIAFARLVYTGRI